MSTRTPLLYALHSGNLYGTERMALATVLAVRDRFAPVLLAPPGPIATEAARHDVPLVEFRGPLGFARELWRGLRAHRELAFVSTAVTHSLLLRWINLLFRRRIVHLHLVHGGTDERLSYGRKARLNGRGVTFVAVSGFVRERLVAHGVDPESIVVVENFLPDDRVRSMPRRDPARRGRLDTVTVISRVDPIKRVDLLLDALDRHPELDEIRFRVLGSGWDLETLRDRARDDHPGVTFEGYCEDVESRLAASDLLLHLCPAEPFGLAILEAMAAGVPVLVPDRGGAGSLVEDGATGFRFRGDDPDDLARRILEIRSMPAEEIDAVVERADSLLEGRFSQTERTADYTTLLEGNRPCARTHEPQTCPSS